MGIVATADNFGKMGSPPVNPELLDWLAVDFMNHGWSAKRLHKMICFPLCAGNRRARVPSRG
jgi:hypothetical protein